MEITGPLIRSSFVRLLTRTTNGLEICYLFITRLGLVLSPFINQLWHGGRER